MIEPLDFWLKGTHINWFLI